jgi:putative signal transducing protein
MPYADLVVARTFLNRFEADVAKSALDAAGIESVVRADDVGGMRPAMWMGSAVQLLVHADDVEQAVEILEITATTRPE